MVSVTVHDDAGKSVTFKGYECEGRRVAIGIVLDDGTESRVSLSANEVKAIRHMLPRL